MTVTIRSLSRCGCAPFGVCRWVVLLWIPSLTQCRNLTHLKFSYEKQENILDYREWIGRRADLHAYVTDSVSRALRNQFQLEKMKRKPSIFPSVYRFSLTL